ncbi:MAG TPA: hypothetical protein VF719_05585, partial [Abditibacteriaceae bacterium]
MIHQVFNTRGYGQLRPYPFLCLSAGLAVALSGRGGGGGGVSVPTGPVIQNRIVFDTARQDNPT